MAVEVKTSRFNKKPSEAYTKALKSLHEAIVAKQEVSRIYAEASSDVIRERWTKKHGVKRASGGLCIQRLFGKRCKAYPFSDCDCLPLGSDHIDMWRRDGKVIYLTSQPYGISSQKLKEVQEYCDRFGLVFDIDALDSWHYPAWTILITYCTQAFHDEEMHHS
jgi:hypothetical protein